MSTIHLIRTSQDLNTLIRGKNGRTDEIKAIVQEAVTENPVSMFIVPWVVRYLTAEIQRSSALRVMAWGEPNWLRYAQQMREFLPDEEIRLAALAIYNQSPWFFYNHGEVLKQIFPNEWFKKLIHDDNLDLRGNNLWNMFLLFNWHSLPESFGPPLDQAFQTETETIPQEDVDLLWTKAPGFACGWMEKNFLEAAKSGIGICLVNGLFYAKYYHRKWSPAKVAYLPIRTCKTHNGYIIWKDYFYAPSNGQHWSTIEAIKSGSSEVVIPDLVIKWVRPTIALTSNQIHEIMSMS